MEAFESEKTEQKPEEVLQELFSNEFPKANIKYVDYAEQWEDIKRHNNNNPENKINTEPVIGSQEDPYMVPFGDVSYAGQYKAVFLYEGSKKRIPDPKDSQNSYILYPSFNSTTNSVETVRIMKYPNEVLDNIDKAVEKIANQENYTLSYQKHLKQKHFYDIPTTRTIDGQKDENGYYLAFPTNNKTSIRPNKYSEEAINQLKKEKEEYRWGEDKHLLPYTNEAGKRRLLIVKNS